MPVHGTLLQPSRVILLCTILFFEAGHADVGTGITFLKLKGKPLLLFSGWALWFVTRSQTASISMTQPPLSLSKPGHSLRALHC